MYIYSKSYDPDLNPFSTINNRINNEDYFSFIYVVPTRRKVRYLIRELIELSPKRLIPELHLFTIGDLAEEIFKGKFKSLTKISSSLQFFLIKKLLKEIELKYFSTKEKYISNGLVDLIIAVITRLKEIGVSNVAFKKEIEQLQGYNRLKAEDISNIYDSYQLLLQELKLYETGDIYLNINQFNNDEIGQIFRGVFPDVNYLLITGFNEFTRPELMLISSLSKVKNLEMIITLDFNEDNKEIFGNLFETHQHLVATGFNFYTTDNFEKKGEFHQHIKKNLFKSSNENKIETKNIFKFTGLDARDEIETIAKIIKLKVIENPEFDLSRVCIAIKGIKEYANLIREIFYKYGIPVNVTDRYYLKNSAPIISIIRLLDLIRKDFFYEDLFYVLRSPYFDFSFIDIKNLRKCLELIKITQGKERILKSIDSRVNYLMNIDVEEKENKDLEIQQLLRAKEDFELLFKLIEPLSDNQSPKDFIQKLNSIIHQLRVYEKIFETQLPLDEEINLITYSKDIRSLNLFESILEELDYTFEKLNLQNQLLSFDRYYDFITTAIFGTRYNIKERWGYGVLVTSPEEIRGLSFSILFLPGLENGLFPSRYIPLIFLEDKFIRNEQQKLLEDRYLFYQCLNAFENELYLSYPRQDEKKEKIVSDFLVELEKLCTITELNRSELDRFIFSESELFEKYSVNDLLDLSRERRELFAKISRVQETILRIKKRIENQLNEEGNEYCGIITDPILLEKLYLNFSNKYFSITELETYAQCPFKYFLNYIIQPEFEEKIEDDIQRNEFGIIIHQILFRFLQKLKTENRNFYEELKNNRERLSQELKEIARDIIKIYERLNPFFFLTEEIILGASKIPSILDQFIELEFNQIDSSNKLLPSYFELPIEKEISDQEFELRLRGKIDRIDIDNTNNQFKVIDYKTGEPPSKRDYDDNISFQLPLYLILVSSHLKSINDKLEIRDAEFIKLAPKKKDNVKRISFLENFIQGRDINSELQKILKIIAELIIKIKNGKFNLTTIQNYEQRICKRCNYQNICRIDIIKKEAINSTAIS